MDEAGSQGEPASSRLGTGLFLCGAGSRPSCGAGRGAGPDTGQWTASQEAGLHGCRAVCKVIGVAAVGAPEASLPEIPDGGQPTQNKSWCTALL